MSVAAALAQLKSVFNAIRLDVRALLSLFQLFTGGIDAKSCRLISGTLRGLETETWHALHQACETLPQCAGPPAPRRIVSVRTQTIAPAAPVADDVRRARLHRRFTRLLHILADPEAALAACARRRQRDPAEILAYTNDPKAAHQAYPPLSAETCEENDFDALLTLWENSG
jgi:hypothetical protein